MKLLQNITLGMAIALSSGIAQAQSQPQEAPVQPVKLDINAPTLVKALIQFTQQSGLQLIFPTDEGTARIPAPKLAGTFTPQAALDRLLQGSGLRYEFINPRTIAIRVLKSDGVSDNTDPRERQLTLARIQNPPQEGEQKARADETTAGSSVADAQGTPEILVKGKRSLNVDIPRTEDAPQPYVVFDSKEIARSQAIDVEDFLRSRLPMNTASTTMGQATGQSATLSAINLRGLGSNQTLILVDGRRIPGIASDGSPFQADLNGIPLSAIERIEVLPSTASGIYGGSATGGVVNIILRRDVQRFEAGATYGNTFDTDTGNIRLDLRGGFNLEGGRTRAIVTATHSDANNMVIGDRDFAARALGLTLAHNAAFLTGSATPPLGATINIRSISGNLVLDSAYGNRPLGSNITNIPLGYAGVASDGGAALVANAGRYNLALPADVNGLERGLIAAPSRESLALNLSREFGERVEAFLDLSNLQNKGLSFTSFMPNLVATLPASAPNNPFQQNIRVRFPTPGMAFESRSESRTTRATAGVILRLARNWTAEGDYGWSRSRFQSSNTGNVIDTVGSCVLGRGVAANVDPDGAGPLRPCAVADPRPALNVLQEGNIFPIDFSPYLMPSPNQIFGPYLTTLKDTTLRISGPAMVLPGGPLTLSALVEHRAEVLENSIVQTADLTTGAPVYSFFPSRSQNADSWYLEARIPVIGSAQALSWVQALELQLSARRDDYTTSGDPTFGIPVDSRDGPFPPVDSTRNRLTSTDYTAGLRFSPSEDLTLRASFGSGFLPPNVTQVAPGVEPLDFSLGSDPRRGNTDMYVDEPFTYISGGSPDLKPERSRSVSAGLILTPRIAPGFRLSIDYTRIRKVDEIRSPTFEFLMLNERLLPGRIVRGPKLEGDEDDWEGPIVSLDQSYLNLAQTEVEAYDFQADYTMGTERYGEFRWYAVATRQTHYRTRVLADEPELDSVGFTAAPLEWRGNLGLDWLRGPLSLSWNAQYYDSYFVYLANAPASLIAFNTLNQGSPRIPSQMYHDLIATYRFDGGSLFARGLLANTEISFGLRNVFDRSPPIVASTSTGGAGYSTYGDPRLRRYSISLRKSFQ